MQSWSPGPLEKKSNLLEGICEHKFSHPQPKSQQPIKIAFKVSVHGRLHLLLLLQLSFDRKHQTVKKRRIILRARNASADWKAVRHHRLASSSKKDTLRVLDIMFDCMVPSVGIVIPVSQPGRAAAAEQQQPGSHGAPLSFSFIIVMMMMMTIIPSFCFSLSGLSVKKRRNMKRARILSFSGFAWALLRQGQFAPLAPRQTSSSTHQTPTASSNSFFTVCTRIFYGRGRSHTHRTEQRGSHRRIGGGHLAEWLERSIVTQPGSNRPRWRTTNTKGV